MTFDSAGRKNVPLYEVLFGYFPDAMTALAIHSYNGNNKHNPGQPLHHARTKSMDHENCIMRHLANWEGMDGPDDEAVALLWRAAALCQEKLERKHKLTVPYRVVDPRAFPETNSLVGPNGEQAPGRYGAEPKASSSETTVLPLNRNKDAMKIVTNVQETGVMIDSDGFYWLNGVRQAEDWKPTSPHRNGSGHGL
jgi:hypothetical protein